MQERFVAHVDPKAPLNMPLPSATEPYDEHTVAWAPGAQGYKRARKYNGSITDRIACVDPYARI